MKKKFLLFSIPFVLLAVFLSHGFLPFLLLPFIILTVNYLVDRKESNPVVQEMKGRFITFSFINTYKSPLFTLPTPHLQQRYVQFTT